MSYRLSPTQVFSTEDLDQEIALYFFQNAALPRRDFIRHKLERQLGGTSISYEDLEDIESLPLSFLAGDEEEGLSENDLIRLLSWSGQQGGDTQVKVDIILGYLDGDVEKALLELLEKLAPTKKSIRKQQKAEKAVSGLSSRVRALIIELLEKQGSQTREQILEALTPIITQIYSPRRPAATIRQALRSLVQSQLICQVGAIYSLPRTEN
jgi:hypothetical protein